MVKTFAQHIVLIFFVVVALTTSQANAQLDTARINVTQGWNLISLPLIVPDGRASVLFPNAVSKAFKYNGGYVARETLQNGIGYWLKFSTAETIALAGTLILSDTISVKSGWNMIGTPDRKVPLDLVISEPRGIIVSRYYGFMETGGYAYADTLEPGRGYWVKASQSGTLKTFPLGGRVRLQNQTDHSGIMVKMDINSPNYDSLMVSTDSLGFFSFDSLADTSYTLRPAYPFFKTVLLNVDVRDGQFTNLIDVALEQSYQFWIEPPETTFSKSSPGDSSYYISGMRQYRVNITDKPDTLRLWSPAYELDALLPQGFDWPYIPNSDSQNTCDILYGRFTPFFCPDIFYDTYISQPSETSYVTLSQVERKDSLCIPSGIYLYFSCLPGSIDYFRYFNGCLIDGKLKQGDARYYKMNRSLLNKRKLFQPAIIHITN